MVSHFGGICNILKYRGQARCRANFTGWIPQMLDEAVGKLNIWTKDEDPTGWMSMQWDENTKRFIHNANEVLGGRRKKVDGIMAVRKRRSKELDLQSGDKGKR